MITLHHLEYSQSFRVLWLLEELGAEYTLKLYNRDPQTLLAPTEYKALSPLGTAPVIEHNGIVLAETGAIVEYILDQFPESGMRPPVGSQDRARHLFWLHASQGSLMPLMLVDSLFRIMARRSPAPLRLLLKPVFGKGTSQFVQPRMKLLLQQAERDLARKPWFGGNDLGAADILMIYPLESAQTRGHVGEQYVHTRDWLQRARSRPAFQAAMQKDGRECMVLPL